MLEQKYVRFMFALWVVLLYVCACFVSFDTEKALSLSKCNSVYLLLFYPYLFNTILKGRLVFIVSSVIMLTNRQTNKHEKRK